MKTKFSVLAAMLMLAAFALQSCLGDDDNDYQVQYLTKSDAQIVEMSMAGTYFGKIYYANRETAKMDSITDVQLYCAGDSILHLSKVPAELLLNFLNSNDNLKKAIVANSEQVPGLKIHMATSYFKSETTAGGSAYSFYTWTEKATFSGVEYNGNTEDYDVCFASTATYRDIWGKVLKATKNDAFYIRCFLAGLYKSGEKTPLLNGYNFNYAYDSNNPYCYFDIAVSRP